MAREATARLYDVDLESVVLNRLTNTGSYDEGTIEFRADEGRFIDLVQLHESMWATRLSGGTRSGIIKLEVTLTGELKRDGEQVMVNSGGAGAAFVLAEDPELKSDESKSQVFQQLLQALEKGDRVKTVTGRVDGWKGRWPGVLREKPSRTQKVFLSGFTLEDE